MILFLKDWQKYPTAIADTNTKNTTFLRMATVLRKMGIKNHAFMLALVNPQLQGVDPYSPDLTREQKMAISLEISINPWYWFREVAPVPADSGAKARPIQANRANISLWWSFFLHITYILIQPRQTGKSLSTDMIMVYLLNFVCYDTKINLLTKDDTLRRANIRRMKAIMDELPPYLRFRGRDDANNGEEITVLARKNYYTTHVPQASEKNANKMGRGLTTAILHIDEGPFQPNISVAFPAIAAAMTAAIENAKSTNSPWGLVMTTTAGKKDDRDGAFMFKKVDESAPWTEMFYDCEDIEDLYKVIKNASRTKVVSVNGTFSHRQLGKSDEWLIDNIKRIGGTPDEIDRDLFNIWTSGGLRSPFSVADTNRMVQSGRPPCFTERTGDGYLIRWYIPEEDRDLYMAENHCIIGTDTSDAVGSDAISLQFVNTRTLEIVASTTINETNIFMFAEWYCQLLLRWKNTTAIIERRSTGSSVLDYLLITLPANKEDPFKRLFNRIVNDAEEDKDRFREICIPMGRRDPSIYARYKKAFGFATSGSGITSRSDLYGTTLTNAVKRGADVIHDLITINQITTLESRNNRIDHPAGGHDDMVIGWLLPHWMLTQGRNLSFYGIDTATVMSDLFVDQQKDDPVELERQRTQRALRDKMEELIVAISKESDPYVTMRLEMQLRALDKSLVLEEGEVFSVEDLISKAREKKRGYYSARQSFDTRDVFNNRMAPVMNVTSDRPLSWQDIYN